MAVRISSFLLSAGKDDDRISGFAPNATTLGQPLYGGMVVTQDQTDSTGKTFKLFDGNAVIGATNPFPLGLLIEPAKASAVGAASGSGAAGVGFDSYNYARGGFYSVFHRPGNILDVYDDQSNKTQVSINGANQNTSAPFVVNRTWAVGNVVYSSSAATVGQVGLLDNSNTAGTGGARIGIVRAMFGSGIDLILTIELDIAVSA
jgi:hypothetical protein